MPGVFPRTAIGQEPGSEGPILELKSPDAEFLNFTVPARTAARGVPGRILVVHVDGFVPFITTISFVQRAVMSMVFHLPPVWICARAWHTSTMRPCGRRVGAACRRCSLRTSWSP